MGPRPGRVPGHRRRLLRPRGAAARPDRRRPARVRVDGRPAGADPTDLGRERPGHDRLAQRGQHSRRPVVPDRGVPLYTAAAAGAGGTRRTPGVHRGGTPVQQAHAEPADAAPGRAPALVRGPARARRPPIRAELRHPRRRATGARRLRHPARLRARRRLAPQPGHRRPRGARGPRHPVHDHHSAHDAVGRVTGTLTPSWRRMLRGVAEYVVVRAEPADVHPVLPAGTGRSG